MSKRVSKEAQIIAWFETAPVAVAEVVFGIVQAVVKRRRIESAPTKRTVASAPRKTRRKRTVSLPNESVPASVGGSINLFKSE